MPQHRDKDRKSARRTPPTEPRSRSTSTRSSEPRASDARAPETRASAAAASPASSTSRAPASTPLDATPPAPGTSARRTDDAAWAPTPTSTDATTSSAPGRFYSRARNRYSQWGGHDTWHEPERSAYGARPAREQASEPGAERPALHHETTGYGFGEREAGTRRARWRREPLVAREIMTKNPKAAHADTPVRDIARIMRDENTGIIPIVDDEQRLQGVVTDRDIVIRSFPEGKNPSEILARDVMTETVEAATPDEALRDVIRMMGDQQIRRVPVVDESDKLVGIISMADVATRADYDTDLQDALQEISSKRSFWAESR